MKLNHGFFLVIALLFSCAAWAQDSALPAPGANPAPLAAPGKIEENKAVKPAKQAASEPAVTVKVDPNPDLLFTPIGTAVVKNENVNVRGKPAFIGEVITKVKKGENVSLLEEIKLKKPKKDEPAKWFRISLPANTPVWVFADFVDETNKTVKSSRLNVRAGPGENFSVIARLKKNDTVKQLRKVGDWIEIEAPANAFAFVAAEFLEKQTIEATAPAPTELAVVPPTETVNVPEPEELKPAVESPGEASTPEPVAESAAPVQPAPAESAPEVFVQRIVKREGIVRKAWNIQAPTYYQLESLDSGKLINYLYSPEVQTEDPETKKIISVPEIDLEQYRNRRVIVTGEESLDKRWKKWPVLEIETIDLQQ